VAEQGKKQMANGPVQFSKDGVKVNVKHVEREDYEDSTQRLVIASEVTGAES
jgi:hypothetical protein